MFLPLRIALALAFVARFVYASTITEWVTYARFFGGFVAIAIVALLLILIVGGPSLAAGQGNPTRGHELYVEYCLQCHGERGEGWGWGNKVPPPPVPIPDLSDATRMEQASDQYLFDIIKGGGEAVGKTRLMPPADRVMTDEEIRDVIRYLRSLSGISAGSRKKAR